MLSTRVQQLNVRTVTKTKDNVTVTLQIAVQYRVINDFVKDTESGEPPKETHPHRQLDFSGVFLRGCFAMAVSCEPVFAGDMDRDDPRNHGIWRAFYQLTDIEQQLRPYVEDVVRSEGGRFSSIFAPFCSSFASILLDFAQFPVQTSVPKRNLDDAYTEKVGAYSYSYTGHLQSPPPLDLVVQQRF